MKPLIVLFWQVCRFQKGPQDVPYSPALLGVLLLAVAALGAASVMWLDQTYQQPKIAGMVVALLAWMGMVAGLLRFKGLSSRFVQAMSACLGTDLIMTALAMPVQYLLVQNPPVEGSLSLPLVAIQVLMVWDLLVKGRIYSASMQLGRFQGNLLSICIWITVLSLTYVFLPPEALLPAAESTVESSQ